MDDTDHRLPNIEVTLYEADENGEIALDTNGEPKLAELKSLEDEFPDLTEQEIVDQFFGGDQDAYDNDYKRRINPTITDEYGYYEFRGVVRNRKYIVKFTYNGQTYMPTEYLTGNGFSYESVAQMVDDGAYDSPENTEDLKERWRVTSKGLEKASERNAYTDRFAEIRSSPENYITTDPFNEGDQYNEVFTTYELLGFELQTDGTYVQTGERLIDSFLTIDDGQIVDRMMQVDENNVITPNTGETIEEGLISKKIKEYIDQNHKYPTDMQNYIYADIVNEIGGDTDRTWRMLQFIEDCKMYSYTLNNVNDDSSYDLYPVYNQFTTYVESGNKYPINSYSNGTFDENASTYANHTMVANGTGEYQYIKFDTSGNRIETTESDPDAWKIPTQQYKAIEYKNVYLGQLYINQGLWRRQEADLALQKDIYKAAIKINGKTEVYDYDSYGHGVITAAEISALKEQYTNGDVFDEEGFKAAVQALVQQEVRDRWDIHIRMSDYDNYYGEPGTYSSTYNHNRAIYRSDYEYVDTNPEAPLEVYITYKISIRNQSQSILGEITEIVDYYDEDYTYQEDLSWVTYDDNDILYEDYFNMMDNIENGATWQDVGNAKDAQSSYSTIYPGTESDITSRTITDGNTGYDNNYQEVYINGLDGKKLAAGETVYAYLTFKINTGSDGKVIINGSIDETIEDKKNIAEINGFRTYYKDNTVLPNYGTVGSGDSAGLIDFDSKPGNLVAEDLEVEKYESNFEDDTDRAKDLHIYVDDEAVRKINGIVWEDERNTESGDDGAVIGDGIRDDDEHGIENIKVELYEIEVDEHDNPVTDGSGNVILKDGPVQIYEGGWTDATEQTTGDGHYEFTGFIPGDYIVRFTYGGDNNATYNGQDFKSTTYQVGIDQSGHTDDYADKNYEGKYVGYTDVENQNETAQYGYNIAKADANANNVSDAKDIWNGNDSESSNGGVSDFNGRQDLIDYSDEEVTNELAYTLSRHTESNPETVMIAETGAIVAEVEYNRQNSNACSGDANYSNDQESYLNGNHINTDYSINNVDLGLVERPKSQLELSKKVTHVYLELANGQILFDNITTGPNLIWVQGEEYNTTSKKTEQDNKIYETYYNEGNISNPYQDAKEEFYNNRDRYGDMGYEEPYEHRQDYVNYVYRKDLITDRFITFVDGNGYNGLIQLSMDEELMHGSTIRIEYEVKVTNVGETDYVTKDFYYRGNAGSTDEIVTTRADQVVDYVSTNLQYRQDENNEIDNPTDPIWEVISTQELIDENLVDDNVKEVIRAQAGDGTRVDQFNQIVDTIKLSLDLKPGESTSQKLVLSQVITSENGTDDLTYDNIAEIVKTSNTVGRRMAYSVVGNQDPTVIPTELDAAKAERVMILPPFGDTMYVYIIIAIAAAAILVVGIILIKKKVIDKK